MSRVRNAMVPRPSTNDGAIMCESVPHPATGNMEMPKNAFILTSTSWPRAAKTKLGTEMPRMTRNMITISGIWFR